MEILLKSFYLEFFLSQITEHFSRIPYSYIAIFEKYNSCTEKLNDLLWVHSERLHWHQSASFTSSAKVRVKQEKQHINSPKVCLESCKNHGVHIFFHDSLQFSISITATVWQQLCPSCWAKVRYRNHWNRTFLKVRAIELANHMHKCLWHCSTKLRVWLLEFS